MDMVDLSIIVPAYNVGKKIGATLASIFAQETKYSYEVLCIDGPSTDNTKEVVGKYAAEHPNLHPIDYEEKNLLGARKLGVSRAKGRYITFCDGDDLEASNAVETMVSALDDSGADMVNTGFYYRKKLVVRPTFFRRDKTYDRHELFEELLRDSYIRGYLWCKAFRREVLTGMNLVVPKSNVYREDQLFTFLAFERVHKAISVKTCTYYYDKRGDSGFSGASVQRVQDFIDVLAFERVQLERLGDKGLLDIFKKMRFRRKIQIGFDLWLNKKAFTKQEYKVMKKRIRAFLWLLACEDTLPVKGESWERFFSEDIRQ